MILATNDDGINARGLNSLRSALVNSNRDHILCGNVQGWTAAGTSLATPNGSPQVARFSDHVWQFKDSPPGLMVAAACSGVMGTVPRAVISGVNHGPNVGRLVHHSGTVGAAVAAVAFDLAAVAVSCDDVYSTGGVEDGPLHLDLAANLGLAILDIAADNGPGTLLNLNVPNLPVDAIAGIRVATCADVVPEVEVGFGGKLLLGVRIREASDISDVALLSAGFATVTVLRGQVDPVTFADRVSEAGDRFFETKSLYR
ncbi:hypothetical protein CH249_01390 [Rhodococcus sp. 05-2255-3B1]|uniref:5'/3'-nucleotidase SurE n=1 Tax=unclassified Rhodococcus (in: high G+C Gram-positive bacteria) TaxID=192944 RepID=UPI000B9C1D0C|nr:MULTISPECIES: 5'/3'-nucleotidase SurE [unclassified Rhodococcus (in: high G+C Gram-positive bacteria)]OZE13448.1 hypothetical protein CH250_05975 [Rhodococcus sp. 05-2255-3C]OZE15937.1 hypothetical protein CH249_01390 [Rhodococcus sp. 05-2255-3B1]OZE18976.1 hypothetical protein CH255_13415 [Rhodococcus sp. 05-2255-2A2]